ncbi:MAG: tRNA uridine-5-carboxymethylaminomethyl(34) synthesis GTPase MnmE [Spirochaetaceae bacterium]|nr:tRNA uridine-5-carboxymethylaminomethyl(34) synthesis GTPase MnmE [Spirochaetaceae bacterium]
MNSAGYTPEEPIAAIATALAPAALGIVRCSGKGVIELLAPLFSRPKALLEAEGNTIVYGWLIEPAAGQEAMGRRIDQVLVSVFRSPRSFTGEDMVEISCHGGPGMVTGILRLLTSHGFRAALPGEFTFRSFINGKADLTRAEAVQEIIAAKTDTSRGRAAGRLAGGLFQELDEIKSLLRETLAALEAEIEYPEDEEAIADAFDSSQLEEARRRLASLCASWSCERLYQDGVRVVLCGRTNAGKSSLFNTLLKEDRSIVSDIHGTTRDWIEGWVSFGGIPARLFDTAGLRESDDEVERHGIQRTQDLTAEADLILYVVDSTVGLTEEDREFLENRRRAENPSDCCGCDDNRPDDNRRDDNRTGDKPTAGSPPLALVLNKWDKVALHSLSEPGMDGLPVDTVVRLSARTGQGTAQLVEEICRLLFRNISHAGAGQVGLGTERQKDCAQAALEAVVHGLEVAEEGYTLDAVVQDVEEALESLGEITGEVTTEDILDTVFSRFCLGK